MRPSSSSADLGPCGAHYAPTMRRQCAPATRPQSASFIQVGARGAHNAPTKRPLCAHYAPAPEAHPLCNAPAMHPLCAQCAPTVRPVPWALPACAPTMRPLCSHSAPSPVGPAGVRAHYAPPCAATLCAHYAPPCAPTVRQPVRRLSSESMAALLCWQNHSCLSTLGGEYDVLALRAWRRFCVWLTPAAGA